MLPSYCWHYVDLHACTILFFVWDEVVLQGVLDEYNIIALLGQQVVGYK